MHEALIVPAVFSKEEALVRGLDDDGILRQAGLFMNASG